MYNLSFYINKAENIDPALWITGSYGKGISHCFLGFCGARAHHTFNNFPKEVKWIDDLFKRYGLNLVDVNDYQSQQFPQILPKDRIIAALYWIRGEMAVEQAQEIVNKVGVVV